jgi:hypothetical protein
MIIPSPWLHYKLNRELMSADVHTALYWSVKSHRAHVTVCILGSSMPTSCHGAAH